MSEEKKTCSHVEKYKRYSWIVESFTADFNTEYEYCFCTLCDKTIYTGNCRFTVNLNRNLPGVKEQIKMSDKKSASKLIKSRFAKEGEGGSLKEFARRLAKGGDVAAETWFDNKHGICNQERTEKNKSRIAAEGNASRNARRKSKKSGSPTALPATASSKKLG